MRQVIVCLSGQPGSGKSTIARLVANSLNCNVTSFGDYLRDVAASFGLSEDIDSLHDIGEALIHEGWSSFCRAVLDSGDWIPAHSLVVDGIRHPEAIKAIRSIVRPMPVYWVFLQLEKSARVQRLKKRDNLAADEIDRLIDISNEDQRIDSLPRLADFVIDGELEPRRVLGEILDQLCDFCDQQTTS